MGFETVLYEESGPLAVLTLNRPDKLNAINAQMVAELGQAMDRAEAASSVRAIVLCGAGRAFSAGFDLDMGEDESGDPIGFLRSELRKDFDIIMRFWDSPKVTICAVQRYCLGSGLELAVAGDITIAEEGSRFGVPEVKFGSGIVSLILPWITGPKQAKEMIMTGNDRVTAQRALEINLINRVTPEGEHMKVAMKLAREMASIDPLPMRLQKMAINRTYEIMGLNEALMAASDIDVLIEGIETPDSKTFAEIARKEGLKAALKRRDPRFATDADD